MEQLGINSINGLSAYRRSAIAGRSRATANGPPRADRSGTPHVFAKRSTANIFFSARGEGKKRLANAEAAREGARAIGPSRHLPARFRPRQRGGGERGEASSPEEDLSSSGREETGTDGRGMYASGLAADDSGLT